MTYALLLDERGRRCPLPVIALARQILDVDPGAVVAVVADDPAARSDIAAWCGMRGHTYLGEASVTDPDLGEVTVFLVRR